MTVVSDLLSGEGSVNLTAKEVHQAVQALDGGSTEVTGEGVSSDRTWFWPRVRTLMTTTPAVEAAAADDEHSEDIHTEGGSPPEGLYQ